MSIIGEALARLKALRQANEQIETAKVAANNRMALLTGFGSNPGNLAAWIYVPDSLPAHAPLVIVLHGCTQTATGYDIGSGWSRLAEKYGFAVLLPEQKRENNANLCFNWFVKTDNRRGSGEALSIKQMIDKALADHDLDRERVYINGLSAGGAMTSVMLATYPEVFAGGAIIAGLPYGCANSVQEAFKLMRAQASLSDGELERSVRLSSNHAGPWPTISVWQGSADQTVNAKNADAIIRQWRSVHGLNGAATRSKSAHGIVREIWSDGQGRDVLEKHTVAGMGHGTPLNSSRDGIGVAGPFMLDAGISSTEQIAHFWHLTEPAKAAVQREPARPVKIISKPQSLLNGHATATRAEKPETASKARPGKAKASTAASSTPTNSIKTVIEDALRAAGLMK